MTVKASIELPSSLLEGVSEELLEEIIQESVRECIKEKVDQWRDDTPTPLFGTPTDNV